MKNYSIPKIKLSDSLSVSRVITGLWQIADMERENKSLNLDATAKYMDDYVKAGFSTFDMADHYGSAELISGIYNQKYSSSSDLQLLTKWVPKPGPCSKEEVIDAVNLSLKRLKMDSIDLLQYHAWNYADPSWLDGLFFLQELKEEGKIKNIGVTNLDTAHLRIALTSGIDIVSNQVCYSLLDKRARNGMTELCIEFGVKILAFGSLAGGFISDKWLEKSEPSNLQTWSQMKYKRYIDESGGWEKFQQLITILKDLSNKKQVSIANIATKYILQQPEVASVIIGARLSETEHIKENQKIFDFELFEHEKKLIDEVIETLNHIPGDCGDEYRKPPFLTASGDLSHHFDKMPLPYKLVKKNNSQKVFSGTYWEDIAGFSRAVKKNNRIYISGTTSTHGKRVIGINDVIAQTNFIIDKIEGSLQSLGSKLEDIVRTRIYIKYLDDWKVVSKVHGQRLSAIQPANTLVKAELIGDEYLVEIEAEAEL